MSYVHNSSLSSVFDYVFVCDWNSLIFFSADLLEESQKEMKTALLKRPRKRYYFNLIHELSMLLLET